MIPLTDPHLLDALDRATGLRWRKEGELTYRVQSSRFPRLFYRVRLTEDGATCECPAVAACRHIALASALAFPELVALWRAGAETERLRREWREAFRKMSWAIVWPYDEPVKKVLADIRALDAEAAEILGTEKMAA